ncbi:unnamed protein product [Prorocentrum cordatum]|uniref:Uncharacterized protein n=1 Tax=Prorocentrum cordatum TaxID=2364126 RepID=A0ABN9X6G3_9DINO|nr:unnamed protein product [Polarella glacialis]
MASGDAGRGVYADIATLNDVVRSGDVALLRAKFVQELAGPMARRQDLPEAAFFQGELTSATVIIALSYGWITPDHPDPECFHLQRVQQVLGHFMRVGVEGSGQASMKHVVGEDRDKAYKDKEVVIFWDWPCLYQDKPKGSRTEVQTQAFKRALNSVNLWYAHACTQVWMLTETPDNVERTYAMRGWCRFERGVSELISSSQTVLDLSLFSGQTEDYHAAYWHTPVLLDSGMKSIMWSPPQEERGGLAERCSSSRLLPQTPDEMSALLDSLTFTNGKSDTQIVQGLYRQTFVEVMSNAHALRWSDQQWAVELPALFPALEGCGSLRILDISGNALTGGLAGLAGFISTCLPALERLDLSRNKLDGELPLELIRRKVDGLHIGLKDNLGFTLPRNLGALGADVTCLDLRDCSLRGTIPRSILELSQLKALRLATNVPRTNALQGGKPTRRTLDRVGPHDPDTTALPDEELEAGLGGQCQIDLGSDPEEVATKVNRAIRDTPTSTKVVIACALCCGACCRCPCCGKSRP